MTNSHHLPACSLLPDGFGGRFVVFVSHCYMWHILTFYFQSFNKVHFCKRTPQIKPEHQLHFKQTPEACCCVLFRVFALSRGLFRSYEFISAPGQTDSQVDASQRKFVKAELAYGLAKGGRQTDSQVATPSRNFVNKFNLINFRKFHAYHWLKRLYNSRLRAINLCRLALGGQTVKNLRLLACKFELDQSPRKST